MTVEMNTGPGVEKDHLLTAPPTYGLAVCRVSQDSVRVYLVAEKDLLALVGDREALELPDNVLRFGLEHHILEYLERAMKAAREVFAGAHRLTASLQRDEYGDPYVAVDVAVPDDPEAEAEHYSACAERWAALIPPEVGAKIQLTTSWASP
jgi:hypothetical protein